MKIPDTKNDKTPTLLDYGEIRCLSDYFPMLGHASSGDQHIPEKSKQQMLMEKMFEKQIYVTRTVRANRNGLSPSINKKQTVKNALVAVRSEQLVSISWMDRTQVRMPSTSSTVVVVEITRHNEPCKIPVAEYNKGRGGVGGGYK